MTIQTKEIDPVCGMSVPPEKRRGSAEYGGRTYTRSRGCLRKFQEGPLKYVGGPSAPSDGKAGTTSGGDIAPPRTGSPPAGVAAVYTCSDAPR